MNAVNLKDNIYMWILEEQEYKTAENRSTQVKYMQYLGKSI